MEVSQKVKFFLLRFGRYNVHIRNMLRNKAVHSTIICPMCENDVEHLLHIFFDCDSVKQYRRVMNLKFNMSSVENASEWLLQRSSRSSMKLNCK